MNPTNRQTSRTNEEAPTPSSERALEAERLLTVEETARLLGLCLDSVRRHLRSGQLQGVRVGRSWRVPQRSLLTQLGVSVAALGVGITGADEESLHRRGDTGTPGAGASKLASSPRTSSPPPDALTPDNANASSAPDVALALLKTAPLRERVRQIVAQATDNADLSARSTERLLAELEDLLAP